MSMYTLKVKEGSLTGYTGDLPENFVIPPIIEGEVITAIAPSAFRGNSDIKSVSIPNTIKRIFKYAFYECENLSSINIEQGENLWALDDSCFGNCNSLELVVLPINISYIGIHAFMGCKNLKEIIAPGVKTLAHDCFKDCGFTGKLTLPPFTAKIAKNAFANNNISELRFPPFVSEIDDYAFNYNPINKVYFQDSITFCSGKAIPMDEDPDIIVASGNSKFKRAISSCTDYEES